MVVRLKLKCKKIFAISDIHGHYHIAKQRINEITMEDKFDDLD